MANKQYHLQAIIATPTGQLTGLINKVPLDALEDAQELRDELQKKWSTYSSLVLFSVEPSDATGVAESFLPGKVMQDSCVLFIIKEEYKLS